jgi:mannose-6-phosphate isomerase-like protein (cupin superfamily)
MAECEKLTSFRRQWEERPASSILGLRGARAMPLTTATPINLMEALESVTEYWSPRVIGRVNDQYIKVAKLKGQFTWHRHDAEDEMFLVLYGSLIIQFEDKDVTLGPGEFCVVPRGVLHNPMAVEEAGIVLIETVTTLHTGNVESPLTRSIEQQLQG